MHSLHAQHLVVALLIIEHACGEIFEHVLIRQGPIGLGCKCERKATLGARQMQSTDLDPLVPDEEPVTVVVWRVQVVEIHRLRVASAVKQRCECRERRECSTAGGLHSGSGVRQIGYGRGSHGCCNVWGASVSPRDVNRNFQFGASVCGRATEEVGTMPWTDVGTLP